MSEIFPYIWLAVILLTVIVEASTSQLIAIWFVSGGLAAMIAAFCHASIWLQIILFLLVSAVVLFSTRTFVKKVLHAKKTSTNADRYIGKQAIVTSDIDNIQGIGQVTALGTVWTARSQDDLPIEKGALVLIERIDGVKLIVSRV